MTQLHCTEPEIRSWGAALGTEYKQADRQVVNLAGGSATVDETGRNVTVTVAAVVAGPRASSW